MGVLSLRFYVIEVIHEDFLPSFWILIIQIFDKIKYCMQVLIFPRLVVIFLDVDQLLFAPIAFVKQFRMLKINEFVIFGSYEGSGQFYHIHLLNEL